MAEKKPLKLKKESSELLKRPFSETKSTPPDRKEYGNSFSKGKEALTPGSSSKDPVRSSSFGKNLVKVGKEFARSNEGKGGSREGKVIVGKEREPKTSELKSPIKVLGKSATKVSSISIFAEVVMVWSCLENSAWFWSYSVSVRMYVAVDCQSRDRATWQLRVANVNFPHFSLY